MPLPPVNTPAGLTGRLAVVTGATRGIGRAIAARMRAAGARVIEMLRSAIGDAGIQRTAARVPIGRLGTPEEIAAFVVWRAGPESTFIGGQNIAIDGGYTRT